MSLFERWAALIEGLQRQNCFRRLSAPAGVDFSSNDYLGYARILKPDSQTMSRSGAASRLLRGHHSVWEQVETTLAEWHGTEAALVLTSGYVANEGLLSTVIEAGDWAASDEFNHASIIDGLRLCRAEKYIYRHNDLNHLEDGLTNASRNRRPGRQLFVVTESLFGMDGDVAPLVELTHLAAKYDAHVIVDEAHATGCFGSTGGGWIDQLQLRDCVLATIHTGGKALAVPGAYICGSTQLKELLVNRCRHLIFTTALPPIVGSWWLETIDRVQLDIAGRASLAENVRTFRTALAQQGITAGGGHYVVPIFVGAEDDAMSAASEIQAAGFDIRAIRPPTVPKGTSRLRVSIHADHDAQTLQRAADVVALTLKRKTP